MLLNHLDLSGVWKKSTGRRGSLRHPFAKEKIRSVLFHDRISGISHGQRLVQNNTGIVWSPGKNRPFAYNLGNNKRHDTGDERGIDSRVDLKRVGIQEARALFFDRIREVFCRKRPGTGGRSTASRSPCSDGAVV